MDNLGVKGTRAIFKVNAEGQKSIEGVVSNRFLNKIRKYNESVEHLAVHVDIYDENVTAKSYADKTIEWHLKSGSVNL